MLTWPQFIGKQHVIIVVIIHYDIANEFSGRKDKLIKDCERGGNYKKKKSLKTLLV